MQGQEGQWLSVHLECSFSRPSCHLWEVGCVIRQEEEGRQCTESSPTPFFFFKNVDRKTIQGDLTQNLDLPGSQGL